MAPQLRRVLTACVLVMFCEQASVKVPVANMFADPAVRAQTTAPARQPSLASALTVSLIAVHRLASSVLRKAVVAALEKIQAWTHS